MGGLHALCPITDSSKKPMSNRVKRKVCWCQNNEGNQLGHEMCLLASVEKQVSFCFEEMHSRVEWDCGLELWYERALEMPATLNPEMPSIFTEPVDPQDK